MLNRSITPRIKDAVEFDLRLRPYEKIILDNNTPVYSINAGVEEVLMIEFVFYAGNAFENQNAIAAAANYLLKNGTSDKSAFQINEHFEYYGAYLTRACYNETATLTLHCLSKHFDKLIPVIREILTDSVFPEVELDIFKQNSKQRLAVSLKKCDFVANRLIDKYLYGQDHPYGHFGVAEDYEALEAEKLRAFYGRYYKQGKCIMFAAGKFPPNFNEQLNKYFGDLDFQQNLVEPLFEPKPANERKYRVENDPVGVQGAVRIARPFPNRHHPDFQKVMILNNVFGGFFGSRLMSNIREDKGYTYGITSYIQNHIHQTAWVISTEAGKDVCEATITEIYKEMEELRDEPIDDEELLLVKNYMMGTNLGDLDGPFQIIARWKNLILNNLDDQYFYKSMHTIKTVSAEELQALAQKYLMEDSFYELVVI
ncbi:MAG: pitrilysin family protein [Chitinophagaceae bacterium]